MGGYKTVCMVYTSNVYDRCFPSDCCPDVQSHTVPAVLEKEDTED